MAGPVEIAVLLLLWYTVSWGCALVVLLFILLSPFKQRTFIDVGAWIQSSFLELLVGTMEVFANIEVEISGDYIPPRENAMVLPNHLNHDWAPLYCMAYRLRMLGWVKTVIKQVVQYVPGFGWVMWILYWPFIKRDWASDAPKLDALFATYSRLKIPLQLWLFSEGTRQTPQKLAESQAYAKQQGYPHFDHVMLPRPKGFIAAVNSLRANVTHVYDVTLAYEGWDSIGPGILEMVTRSARRRVFHIHVRRIPIGDLPIKEDELKKWLMKCFEGKEAVLKEYYSRKCMPGTQHPKVKPTLFSFLFPLVFWVSFVLAATVATLRMVL